MRPRPQNRRDLLANAAKLSAASLFPTCIQRALSLPANRRAGTLQDVRHVVILMMENRGFDHYFGTLRGVRGFGDRHPVPLESGKPVWFQSDGTRETGAVPSGYSHDQRHACSRNTAQLS